MEINDIPAGNPGVLGGPVALAALQADSSQEPLDVSMGTGDPALLAVGEVSDSLEADLSTGSVDGTKPFQGISAPREENSPSLVDKNKAALKAVAALSGSQPAGNRAQARYFIQPTSGKNWGVRHANNAVDIANSCGTSVLAAAAGKVVSDSGLGSGATGWNSGFGKFALISHDNGTKTRYAHLSKVSVAVGEQVSQGQEIGKIGNTGRVEGRTGCHLHFEVIGGANPFVRR